MNRAIFQNNQQFISEIEKIHKFRQYNLQTLESISENYIWFATMAEMNDPFEGLIRFEVKDRFEDVAMGEIPWFGTNSADTTAVSILFSEYEADPKYFFEKYSLLHGIKYEEQIRHARNIGCYSGLTEFQKRLGKPTNHEDLIRMWSYYGDGLRGFRISYHPKSILISEDVSMYYIKYESEPESVDASNFCYRIQHPDAPRFRAYHLASRFGVKSKLWEYEKELRIVTDKPGKLFLPDDAVHSITFGQKMPTIQRRMIARLVRYKNPQAIFFVASTSSSSYEIVHEEIEIDSI